MSEKFRKKPVTIEALRWTGENVDEMKAFCPEAAFGSDLSHHAYISTLEGQMTADPGDWIIRGVKGEFYPCKPDIFSATYEPAASSGLDPETITKPLSERDTEERMSGDHAARLRALLSADDEAVE